MASKIENNPIFMPLPPAVASDGEAAVKIAADPAKPGLRVTFKDVSFTVGRKGKGKQLLINVSGFMEEHAMTALLGPSGAGKSTLLDVLSGRMRGGTISGQIRFAGIRATEAFLRRYTGYVEQFDVLIPGLTVRETFLYTAELKCPLSKSYSDKVKDAQMLIDQLGLRDCADTRVVALSGGESKRTNIGIALIAGPAVLWLDEPTSGLDSHSANEVVQVLHNLTRTSITVVSTIHSPSAQAFAMFDRVMILAGGQVVFFGPQGERALQFARDFWPGGDEHHLECSAAEYLIDLVTQAHRNGQSQMLADTYRESDLCRENTALLQPRVRAKKPRRRSVSEAIGSLLGKDAPPPPTDATTIVNIDPDRDLGQLQQQADEEDRTWRWMVTTKQATATPTWWGIWVLLKYRTSRNFLDAFWVGSRLLDKLTFSVIVVTLYLRIGDIFSQDNLVNLAASLFLWAALPAYSALTYMPGILMERKLHYREHADGLYHVHTYFISKLIEEVSLCTLFSLGISSYVFYGVQYQGSFVFFWLVYLITMAIGVVVGYVIAAFSPNLDVATAVLPGYVTTLLFFSGQVMTFSTIPKYWYWYSRADFLRYAWVGLMANQFAEEDPVAICDGTTIMQYYSINGENKWDNLCILVAFFFGYALLAYVGLVFVRHSTGRK